MLTIPGFSIFLFKNCNLKTNYSTKIGLFSAVSVIISSMVGTGVYTSLGYQLAGIQSTLAILVLWILGGVMALCGAAVYGELAVRLPRSGGEYHFLSQIYHPALGFLSGWVSSTVGFAAPAALSSMAFANYFYKLFPELITNSFGMYQMEFTACLLVLFATLINIFSIQLGAKFQSSITLVNIVLILVLIVSGIYLSDAQHFSIYFDYQSIEPIFSRPFAVSLVFVSFAYSGWNSVTYITSEVDNPQKNLPKSLFLASFTVLLLYVGLNFVFLYSTPAAELVLKNEVGFIAGQHIFGEIGGKAISLVICIALFASVNSITIAGPRVSKTIGEDFPQLRRFSNLTGAGSPAMAIVLQSFIAIILIVTASFEKILTYIGFTLSLFTCLTVFGLFILRSKSKDDNLSYKTIGYPITPIIFIGLELWMIVFTLIDKPLESFSGFATILTGLIVYYALKRKDELPRS